MRNIFSAMVIIPVLAAVLGVAVLIVATIIKYVERGDVFTGLVFILIIVFFIGALGLIFTEIDDDDYDIT